MGSPRGSRSRSRRSWQGAAAGANVSGRRRATPGIHQNSTIALAGPTAVGLRSVRRDAPQAGRTEVGMSALDLARIQFASTSIYHFFFVPVTIGLAFLVAILHTLWYRSGNDQHLRLTKFFGTLFLINVAVGVVTGLVQEF